MAFSIHHKPAADNFKRAKLLIIEDDADHRLVMQKVLAHCLPDVSLLCVDNANEALQLMNDWCTQEWELPKMIVQDLYMPNRATGWDILQQLKQLPSPGNHIPVIIFSSSNNADDIAQAYKLGAASYLVKPIDAESWSTFLNELCIYWWEVVTLPPLQFSI